MNPESSITIAKHPVTFTRQVTGSICDLIIREDDRSKTFFVLADQNTFEHCYYALRQVQGASFKPIIIKPGEQNKNLATCEYIWNSLREYGADRNSVLINLGGGVVCDLGGFAASTYMRGIRFVNVPTSLLAMTDASLGGKNGIDLAGYKNMVGVFASPMSVIIDPVFLKTLSGPLWRDGIVETLKHALISDDILWKDLFQLLIGVVDDEELMSRLTPHLHELIRRSVEIKGAIVNSDPFEKGNRKFLNFGHTIGHAIESFYLDSGHHLIGHGEAVAAGIICESYISNKMEGLDIINLNEICSLMKGLFPLLMIPDISFDDLKQKIKSDKKSMNGNVTFSLLSKIGKPVLSDQVPELLIEESFRFLNAL